MREPVDAERVRSFLKALAKIERGFARDITDVRAMVARGLVDATKLEDCARQIVPELVRYPAVDPDTFLRAVTAFVESLEC